jgi:hypothetical protein
MLNFYQDLEALDLMEESQIASPNNLSGHERKVLRGLGRNQNLVIKPTDKNLGIAVIERNAYVQLAEKLLNNTETYEALAQDPLKASVRKLKSLCDHLCTERLLDDYQYMCCLPPDQPRIGKFYFMPKVHKEKLGTRPIISQINHPTSRMSNFLGQVLQPIAESAPSFCRNSFELLQDLAKLKAGPNTVLISADLKDMYTNIPQKAGVDAVASFYGATPVSHRKVVDTALRSLLHNTLCQNYFEFHGKFYRQVNGTAMGTKMAPAYANTYLRSKEEPWLESEPLANNILLFRRYLDDLFLVFDDDGRKVQELIGRLREAFLPLELTVKTSTTSMVFLDVTVRVNHMTGKFESSMYRKETASNCMIPFNSAHPPHCLNNIPANEFDRIERLCSRATDSGRFKLLTVKRALSSGYAPKPLKRLLRGPRREQQRRPERHAHTTVLTYNRHIAHLLAAYRKTRGELPATNISWRCPPNLKRQLVRATLKPIQ